MHHSKRKHLFYSLQINRVVIKDDPKHVSSPDQDPNKHSFKFRIIRLVTKGSSPQKIIFDETKRVSFFGSGSHVIEDQLKLNFHSSASDFNSEGQLEGQFDLAVYEEIERPKRRPERKQTQMFELPTNQLSKQLEEQNINQFQGMVFSTDSFDLEYTLIADLTRVDLDKRANQIFQKKASQGIKAIQQQEPINQKEQDLSAVSKSDFNQQEKEIRKEADKKMIEPPAKSLTCSINTSEFACEDSARLPLSVQESQIDTQTQQYAARVEESEEAETIHQAIPAQVEASIPAQVETSIPAQVDPTEYSSHNISRPVEDNENNEENIIGQDFQHQSSLLDVGHQSGGVNDQQHIAESQVVANQPTGEQTEQQIAGQAEREIVGQRFQSAGGQSGDFAGEEKEQKESEREKAPEQQRIYGARESQSIDKMEEQESRLPDRQQNPHEEEVKQSTITRVSLEDERQSYEIQEIPPVVQQSPELTRMEEQQPGQYEQLEKRERPLEEVRDEAVTAEFRPDFSKKKVEEQEPIQLHRPIKVQEPKLKPVAPKQKLTKIVKKGPKEEGETMIIAIMFFFIFSMTLHSLELF